MHNVWAERWTEKGHVGHFWNVGPPAPHLQTKPFPPENAETAQSHTIKFESLFLGRNHLSRLVRRVEQMLARGVDRIG